MSGSEIISAEKAGKICPYCHTELLEGDAAVTCENCESVHHEDCWEEGGGCSVIGCAAPAQAAPSDGGSGGTEPPAQPGAEATSLGGRSGIGVLGGVFIGLGVATVLLVAFLLLVGGDGDSPSTEPPGQTETEQETPKQDKEPRNQNKKASQKPAGGNSRIAFGGTTDPGGHWTGELPKGSGWSAPAGGGNINSPGLPPLYRTTLSGPNGSFVQVDTTSTEDPRLNENNFTVAGVRLTGTQTKSNGMDYAETITYDNGIAQCSGLHCAKALMSDGAGGGITILVGSPWARIPIETVKRFAASVTRQF